MGWAGKKGNEQMKEPDMKKEKIRKGVRKKQKGKRKA